MKEKPPDNSENHDYENKDSGSLMTALVRMFALGVVIFAIMAVIVFYVYEGNLDSLLAWINAKIPNDIKILYTKHQYL